MDATASLDANLNGLIEAEGRKFQATTIILGSTAELVQDFQDLYQSLADFVKISGDGITREKATVGGRRDPQLHPGKRRWVEEEGIGRCRLRRSASVGDSLKSEPRNPNDPFRRSFNSWIA